MDDFEIKIRNGTNIKGLFVKRFFSKGEILFPIKGKLLKREETVSLNETSLQDLLQVSLNDFLDLTNEKSFFINHSCNPNTYIKLIGKSAFLATTRAILPNEELRFDWAVTSTDTPDEWSMTCNCGEWNCRKIISGFNSIPHKEYLITNGFAPKYAGGVK